MGQECKQSIDMANALIFDLGPLRCSLILRLRKAAGSILNYESEQDSDMCQNTGIEAGS